MEQTPNEERSFQKEEQELSFEEQLVLATKLLEANDRRNRFVEGYGGFDTFAEVWQHVEGKREEYDALADVALQARRELDEKVSDKRAFVEQLRKAGHEDIAESISEIFAVSLKTPQLSKGGFFSRFRKKL